MERQEDVEDYSNTTKPCPSDYLFVIDTTGDASLSFPVTESKENASVSRIKQAQPAPKERTSSASSSLNHIPIDTSLQQSKKKSTRNSRRRQKMAERIVKEKERAAEEDEVMRDYFQNIDTEDLIDSKFSALLSLEEDCERGMKNDSLTMKDEEFEMNLLTREDLSEESDEELIADFDSNDEESIEEINSDASEIQFYSDDSDIESNSDDPSSEDSEDAERGAREDSQNLNKRQRNLDLGIFIKN